MILKSEIKYEKSLGKLNCNICGTRFRENTSIYKINHNSGFVCEHCNKAFSKEDIRQLLFIFHNYGGYFGKYKKIPLDIILNEFFDSLLIDDNLTNLLESNIKLCHKALLHGYTPQELIQKMRELNRP